MTDYIVLLLGDTEAWWDTPEDEKKAIYDVHGRFTEELERRGHTIIGGAELPRASEAKSLKPYADTVTDGPWTETTEQLGGYYEVRTDDLDDLMDVCTILAATGDAVEVHRKITGEGGRVMKYLVLLIGDGELKPWPDHTEAEQQEVMRQFEAFDAACREREGVEILAGEALAGPDQATTVRTRGGRTTLTEGPYAEVIEAMGGFYLIEAPDLDVLVELLGILPAYDMQLSPAVDPY